LAEHGNNRLDFVLYSTLIIHNLKDFSNGNVLPTIVLAPLQKLELLPKEMTNNIHLYWEPFRNIKKWLWRAISLHLARQKGHLM